MRIAILIPAFNQTPWPREFQLALDQSCAQLSKLGLEPYIVFVDDGSSRPQTTLHDHFDVFSKLTACRVFATSHGVNRGQGAALMTALNIALSNKINADYFATLDADGQHDPMDIVRLYEELKSKSLNIIFSNRFGVKGKSGVPFIRRTLLRCASLFERFLTGLNLTDAHNGFRLFDKKTAEVLMIRQDRMAHATEIKQKIAKHSLQYGEMPITIHYTEESIRNGQKSTNALNILRELFQGWMFQ